MTIERLQMAQGDYHEPALLREVVEQFVPLDAGVVVDATVGGGGHAAAILDAAPQLRVLGVDRDPDARAASAERFLGEPRARVVAGAFGDLAAVLRDAAGFVGADAIVGVLMDLGVSSHQLDEATRGFSFRADAPLDMRMDPDHGETAAHSLSRVDEHELARVLRANGEARFAGAIARAVVAARPTTTTGLVTAVEAAVPPAARRRGHVATRVFQAVRVEVNDEAGELARGLAAGLDALAVGGVLAVISYHSGEDRVVKAFLRDAETGGCTCPPGLPCVCGATPRVSVLRPGAILARADEVAANPRSRSARLRVAHKVAP
ncbi:MAG TPA: 16S rRNA (cytosine(1402)-N(4))-methyltransferase RsmH [Acidimicrobiales bacterium]|nr:16S rRNA (cytosine(1402)-N(4))-methyltransferase RsmH [Acidimicrobiales bacterium]